MKIKLKRLLIRIVIHGFSLIVLTILVLVAQDIDEQGPILILILLYLATMRINPLPKLVETRIFRSTVCPACGAVIELENTFTCGCGYFNWEPRHAFSPCRHCKKVFTWLVCPRCEGSIPL